MSRGAISLQRYKHDWHSMFYYDKSSPSCLRWKRDVLAGNKDVKYITIKKHTPVGTISKCGYYSTSLYLGNYKSDSSLKLHRIIWTMFNGDIQQESLVVDHIDGNTLNNKIENLRLIPKGQNTRNTRMYKNNTSGITGVYFEPKANRFKAMWIDLDRVQRSKVFNINKYGYDKAFEMACQYREKMIQELNEQGVGYSERHGK